jgi:hypothetical protein
VSCRALPLAIQRASMLFAPSSLGGLVRALHSQLRPKP